jgi:hypothetical protein
VLALGSITLTSSTGSCSPATGVGRDSEKRFSWRRCAGLTTTACLLLQYITAERIIRYPISREEAELMVGYCMSLPSKTMGIPLKVSLYGKRA